LHPPHYGPVRRRDATTAEKLRGPRFGSQHRVGRAGVSAGGGRSLPLCGSEIFFENSDAKSCILVIYALISNNTCCEISCFLKTTAKKLGDTLLVPQPKSWGTSLPRSPRLLRLWFVVPKMLSTNRRQCIVAVVGYPALPLFNGNNGRERKRKRW